MDENAWSFRIQLVFFFISGLFNERPVRWAHLLVCSFSLTHHTIFLLLIIRESCLISVVAGNIFSWRNGKYCLLTEVLLTLPCESIWSKEFSQKFKRWLKITAMLKWSKEIKENCRIEKKNAYFYIVSLLSHQLYCGSLERNNNDDDKIIDYMEEPQKTHWGLKVLWCLHVRLFSFSWETDGINKLCHCLLFIYSFNKYLLSTYDVPGTLLSIKDWCGKKQTKFLPSWILHCSRWQWIMFEICSMFVFRWWWVQ